MPPGAPEIDNDEQQLDLTVAPVGSPASEETTGLIEVCPVVGVGASAGGLAAFEAFFSAVPADPKPGAAFVVVQHLAADHASNLAELIGRYTWMQVAAIRDGDRVRSNCVYVLPPGAAVTFAAGHLHLFEPAEKPWQRLPIDFFFASLADELRAGATGVVLSGSGSDGAKGAAAIKDAGGFVLVQTPDSATHDGMPSSAIAMGRVDEVLPPEDMPARLAKHFADSSAWIVGAASRSGPLVDGILEQILRLVHAQTGNDFSKYKPTTLLRRIERRLALHRIEQLADYLRFLEQSPEEAAALGQDFLIGVTRFFRDPVAFDLLEKTLLPPLIAGLSGEEALRVWVPGCATGEEAYTLAILVREHLERERKTSAVQIFATDIDAQAIAKARRGWFPASIAADVSAERLDRHFLTDRDGAGFQIQRHVRESVIFSIQNVVRDPPFSRLDLISCRNLLIYMGAELQTMLLRTFHYALKPSGLLLLGSSETTGEGRRLFALLDRQIRIYTRQPGPSGGWDPGRVTPRIVPAQTVSTPLRRRATADRSPMPLKELTERALLEHHGAVAVLVKADGSTLYVHGRTGLFLEPAPGELDTNVLHMAREGLREALAAAVHRANLEKTVVHRRGVQVKTNGAYREVDVTVRPVSAVADYEMLLIVFELPPAAAQIPPPEAPLDAMAEPDERVQALQAQLRAKDEHLQTTQEEMQVTNEDLRTSNEELQSANEELQSANEELETSKEELQSLNEELATVNAELQAKVSSLSQVTDDMSNLLAATDIGTIYVDHKLRIQRFTPAVTQLLNVIDSDVGRPLAHIVSNLLSYESLVKDLQLTLDTLVPREAEVQSHSGAWFLLRIRPYRTVTNAIEGAVVTFVDITEVKAARLALEAAEPLTRLAIVVRDSSDAMSVQDLSGKILAWNPAATRLYGWSEEEALGMSARDRVPPEHRDTEAALERAVSEGHARPPRRAVRVTKAGAACDVWVTTSALVDAGGTVYALANTETRTPPDAPGGEAAP